MTENTMGIVGIVVGIIGIFLSLVTVILTILLHHFTDDKIAKIKVWHKTIPVLAACLALTAAGTVINVLKVQVNVRGDNNSISVLYDA